MDKKYWLYGVALLVSFASGRFLVPEKVKIEKQIVEVEKKSLVKDTDSERNKHKETVVTEKINSDGSKETTTHVIEETQASKKENESNSSESAKDQRETKEVERGSSKTTVGFMAGTSFTSPQVIYGVSVYRGVLGPIGIGVWGLTNGIVGASIGISF